MTVTVRLHATVNSLLGKVMQGQGQKMLLDSMNHRKKEKGFSSHESRTLFPRSNSTALCGLTGFRKMDEHEVMQWACCRRASISSHAASPSAFGGHGRNRGRFRRSRVQFKAAGDSSSKELDARTRLERKDPPFSIGPAASPTLPGRLIHSHSTKLKAYPANSQTNPILLNQQENHLIYLALPLLQLNRTVTRP